MSLYEHPNITKLWGFFEEGPKFYMVMDYCTDGYLYNLIKNFDHKREMTLDAYGKKIDLIRQICMAIEFLHENGVMHRDIKPENILLTMGDSVKISDFGWARIIHSPSEELRRTLCGTPLYLAPERIRQSQYSKSVDLWAIGILTYELLTGKIPFTIESL
jgi:serine/threonine protein kinase